MNTKFQNALNGITQNTPPIWFMRQAGRYHKHYQALRKAHSFVDLCKTPKLAAEVAMGPIEDFDFDVSILFSDLLFPLDALGMGLTYEPGPKLKWQLSPENIKNLKDPIKAQSEMNFQAEAVELTRSRLPDSKSLIGFVGAPWTLFTYAVEGAHKGELQKSKSQPELFQNFYELLLPLLKYNIEIQLKAGVEIVMLFDTSAGNTSPSFFNQYILPKIKTLSEAFPKKLAYYLKGSSLEHYEKLKELPWAGLGYDHRFKMTHVLKNIKHEGVKQGNFDQSLLFLPEIEFKKELESYHSELLALTPEERNSWVCGLGHGVLPQTPEEHVRYFVQQSRKVFS